MQLIWLLHAGSSTGSGRPGNYLSRGNPNNAAANFLTSTGMSAGLARALQRMKTANGGNGTLVNCLEEELDAQQQEQLSK